MLTSFFRLSLAPEQRNRQVPVFDEQAGLWRELLGPNRAPTDRQWALCVYDDLVEYAPSAIQSYMEHFFEHMFNYVNSEEPICRQVRAVPVLMCVCLCVLCVRVCVRVCVRMCVCVCARV